MSRLKTIRSIVYPLATFVVLLPLILVLIIGDGVMILGDIPGYYYLQSASYLTVIIAIFDYSVFLIKRGAARRPTEFSSLRVLGIILTIAFVCVVMFFIGIIFFSEQLFWVLDHIS